MIVPTIGTLLWGIAEARGIIPKTADCGTGRVGAENRLSTIAAKAHFRAMTRNCLPNAFQSNGKRK